MIFSILTTHILFPKAEDWSEAHKVIIGEIAPTAILSQNYAQLEAFLTQIAEPSVVEKVGLQVFFTKIRRPGDFHSF